MAFLKFLLFLVLIIYTEQNDESNNIHRNLDSDGYSNINIYVDYSCFISSQNTTKNELIKNAISKAQKTLEKLIKVEPLKTELFLEDYKNLIDFGVCSINLNLRVRADLVIFVVYRMIDNPVDFAVSEIIKNIDNDVKKRPIVGLVDVHFSPSSLTDDDSKLQAWSTMFLHEFTHILGFNKTIFESLGLLNSARVTNRMNNNNQTKYFFIGHKAVQMAQNYFNCSQLPGDGIEMDIINGIDSLDGSNIHWSGRILMGDYMIAGLYYIEQSISEITLASLEDLG